MQAGPFSLRERDTAKCHSIPVERFAATVGDGFRGGLMKGMAVGRPLKECAQLGSVAAAYALEHLGGQSHAYTMKEFGDRYAEHFGPLTF